MGTLNIRAVTENNKAVMDFITAELADFPALLHSDILVAVEEIFVNIANYAYPPNEKGFVFITADIGKTAVIRFEDSGKAFDPLAARAPDLNVPLAEREIGGLGLHFVKNLMDDVKYERIEDKNILTITKGG